MLDMLLINCELVLTSLENFITTDEKTKMLILIVILTDTELYIPAVTFTVQHDNKLLVQLKTGFKRTIKWYK